MKLVGYAFTDPDGPVRAGYMPLDELSVVLGPNDAGKSRLVQDLAARLGERRVERKQEPGHAGAAFFVELDLQGKMALLSRLRRDIGTDFSLIAGAVVDDAYVSLSDTERATLVAELSSSSLFAFEPRPGEVEGDWQIYWALPSRTWSDPVLGPVVDRIVRDEDDLADEIETLLLSGSAFRPAWRMLRGVPPSLEIGAGASAAVPRAVRVPMSWDELERRCANVVEELLSLLYYYERNPAFGSLLEADAEKVPAILNGLALYFREWSQRAWTAPPQFQGWTAAPSRKALWLSAGQDADSLVLSPDLIAISAIWRDEVSAALPRFVSERYVIGAMVESIWSWTEERPVGLHLLAGPIGSTFDIRAAAEGHQLWLQLAVLEANERLSQAAARVRRHLEDALDWTAEINSRARARDEEPGDQDCERDFDEAVREVRRAVGAYSEGLAAVRRAELPEGSDEALLDSILALADVRTPGLEVDYPRPLLYVLDEPERHLHPALQPVAAQWLNDTVRQRRSQAVVITHAVPFLNLGEGTSYTFVSRADDGYSRLEGIDAAGLTAMSSQAAELGLNRGQLLAGVNAFLFVEGRADQIVMEELFGSRLRSSGIAITPLTGAGKHAQIFESDLLLRFTTASLAILLDNVRVAELKLLQNDSKALGLALRGKRADGIKALNSTEIQALASVIRNAKNFGRHVEPFVHPGPDIFDLLDEEVIANHFPLFPGHESASRAFADRPRENNRKLFYEKEFRIPPGLETYVLIAGDMRRRDVSSPQLEAVMVGLEFYVLTEVVGSSSAGRDGGG